METEEISEDYVLKRKQRVQQIVDIFWSAVTSEYQEEDLSEDDLMDVFAALGICAGAGCNEAFYANHTLPYQLFGILSDMCFQTQYTHRFGLDLEELERARQQQH